MYGVLLKVGSLCLISWFVLSLIASCFNKNRGAVDIEILSLEPIHESPDPAFKSLPQKTVRFSVSEGTHISVDVSPDGKLFVFDLLGDLYLLPQQGGDATPLTRGRSWDQAPTFSPDGRYIAFVSDRIGYKNLWLIDLKTRVIEQVTNLDSDIMGSPNWSDDGRSIIVGRSKPNDTEVILELINLKSGEISQIAAPDGDSFDYNRFVRLRPSVKMYTAVKTDDNVIYFDQMATSPSLGRRVIRIYELDRETGVRRSLTPKDASFSEYKPQLSNNGELIAYFRQYQDRRTELRVYNRRTRQSKSIVELDDRDDASFGPTTESTPNYTFSPDDQHIFFWRQGRLTRLRIADGLVEPIEFSALVELDVWQRIRPQGANRNRARVLRWPTVSKPSGHVFVNAFGYVWMVDADTGAHSRVTDSDSLEFMPSISPDGGTVAFVSYEKSGVNASSGRLILADIETGETQALLGAVGERYLFPTWSPDGNKIAVIKETGAPGAWTAEIGWIGLNNPTFRTVADVPSSSDYPSLWVYSRTIGFDSSSENLIYSYRTSLTETVLKMSDLKGNPGKTVAIGTDEIGGISASPDLQHLALTRRDGTIWVTPFDPLRGGGTISTRANGARFVSPAGYNLTWTGSNELFFGFGSTLYEYSVDDAELISKDIRINLAPLASEKPVAFTNARLLTMADGYELPLVIDRGTLISEGSRISHIGPSAEISIPPGTTVIDVAGKTIIPGLLDTHYHRIGGGAGIESSSGLQLPNPNFGDVSALAYGITSAWEPGGPADDGIPASADLQLAGRIVGPRWSYSAIGPLGYPFDLFENYQDADRAVKRNKALGVDVAKEYDTPTRLQRQWLAKAAYENGLGIVAHIENFDGFLNRIIDGYTGGEHALFPVPFYSDVQQLLAQTGFVWTPNASAPGGNVGDGYASTYYFWSAVLEHRPEEEAKFNRISPGHGEFWASLDPGIPYDLHRVSRVAEQTAQAADKGVAIGVSAHDMPGILLHGELWYLWKGGMPIYDVLRAATMGNAEKLGLQNEIGSLEVGKHADFIILSENPLDNILNTLSIEYTVQGGMIYHAETAERVDPATITTAALRKAAWRNVRPTASLSFVPDIARGLTHFCEIHGEWHAFHRPFRRHGATRFSSRTGLALGTRKLSSLDETSNAPKSFSNLPYLLWAKRPEEAEITEDAEIPD